MRKRKKTPKFTHQTSITNRKKMTFGYCMFNDKYHNDKLEN